MATSLDSGWAEIPGITNGSLTEKHERFLDLKVRVVADELITFSKEGIISRNFALNDGGLKRQVEQALLGENDVREKVDQLLDHAISTVSNGFDARVNLLNRDLRLVLSSQSGKSWGIDRNLKAYRLEGLRASVMGLFCNDRGTNAEICQALNSKLTEIREASVSMDNYVLTDLEIDTINLIDIAIKTRYAALRAAE